ncbi:T9SS type A sorting domain-containing protein [Rubrivirga litoralis]|uniref:T9SS type A sorting domain-containing protein n=1 Tax=Rubrivirga litoralis TaxID=3075598 RepID=A0ABU3BMS7_9BACT|nr:T9SS type A sorting domain-containing protein [Rubrivirga sp. F394]MDT0630546.1 T9SS type A sorting domain-containing protein [Rubrivirga sp. F394]
MSVAVLYAPSATAQDAPPRPETARAAEASPNAEAFFPLLSGSVFDYASEGGAALRRSVTGDTLIGATSYASVVDSAWAAPTSPARVTRYLARYDAGSARVVVWDGSRERPSPQLAPCPLGGAGAVDCAAGGAGDRRQVTVGEGALAIAPGHEVSTRTYASEAGFGVLVLAEGLGPVVIAGPNGTYVLQYAHVGLSEVGTPLRSDRPAHGAPAGLRVRAWPNPAAGPVTLRVEGAAPGPATAEVFDALGRRVLVVPLPSSGAVREAVLDLDLSPGAYVVRVQGGAGGGAAVRFVKL